MWKDEIVEEIHRIREQYAREHHFDVDEIYKDIKEKEQASGRNLVRLPPKRLEPDTVSGDGNVDAA